MRCQALASRANQSFVLVFRSYMVEQLQICVCFDCMILKKRKFTVLVLWSFVRCQDGCIFTRNIDNIDINLASVCVRAEKSHSRHTTRTGSLSFFAISFWPRVRRAKTTFCSSEQPNHAVKQTLHNALAASVTVSQRSLYTSWSWHTRAHHVLKNHQRKLTNSNCPLDLMISCTS